MNAWVKRIEELEAWVNDLQSGMYINCVYCGHRYGPKESTPFSMADVLKEHIEQCPKHPMSALKQKVSELEAENAGLKKQREETIQYFEGDDGLVTEFEARIKSLTDAITDMVDCLTGEVLKADIKAAKSIAKQALKGGER